MVLGLTFPKSLKILKVLVLCLVIIGCYSGLNGIRYLYRSRQTLQLNASSEQVLQEYWDDVQTTLAPADARNFDGFDNRGPGFDEYIVPNIVHYIRFNSPNFTFVEVVCLKSAYYQIKPDYFYIHSTHSEFGGYYWNKLKEIPDLIKRIKILPIKPQISVFGQPFSRDWHLWHASDVARIKTLIKYGGIFLDNDVYIVKNIHKYRRYEMVFGWENVYFAPQVLVAHKDARFLREWLKGYREYKPQGWVWNTCIKPSRDILPYHPEYVRIAYDVIHAKWQEVAYQLYRQYWPGWRNVEAIHILYNHRPDWENYIRHNVFTEANIQSYPHTWREMALDVYYNTSISTATPPPLIKSSSFPLVKKLPAAGKLNTMLND